MEGKGGGAGKHTRLDAEEPREVERFEKRHKRAGPVHVGEARKHVHHLSGEKAWGGDGRRQEGMGEEGQMLQQGMRGRRG